MRRDSDGPLAGSPPRGPRPPWDARELADLYEAWAPTVWTAARAIVSCEADADEAVQRVFFRIHRNGARTPKGGWTAAYFHKAGRNEARMRLRGKQREIPLSRRIAARALARGAPPDLRLDIEELLAVLHRWLERLPPRCTAVMKLRLEGASNPDIAEVLGISVSAVEKQAARGRRLLRARLNGRERDVSSLLDGGGRGLEH